MGISRYIARQITISMAIIVLSLTCLIWLSQSLRFIDIIINHGLPLATFVYLTFLLLPNWLSVILPITGFTAVLYTYHRMAGDREITILETAGLSPFSLARPAILIALLITGLSYLLTLYLAPLFYRSFKELQFEIRHNYTDVLLREGVFNVIGNKITVYVRERQADGVLKGMIIHDSRNEQEKVTLIAESGALVMTDEGPLVFMRNGNRQSRNTTTGRVGLLYFDRYSVNLGNARSTAERLWRDQNELFLTDLMTPTKTVTSPRNFNEYIAEGHFRLSAPFLGLTLPLIGLTVLLRSTFSRRSLTPHIVLAITLAVIIKCANLGSKMLVARHPWLTPVMYGIVLAPALIAFLLLIRPMSGRVISEPLREQPS